MTSATQSGNTTSDMTDKPDTAVWPVRPLTRTRKDDGAAYTREADVEAEIRALSGLADKTRKMRLLSAPGAWGSRERVREETLVYFVREYTRRGDEETAWAIVEALIARTDSHVARKLGRWRLTADETDDCARDLYAALCEALLDTGASAEFWEVRFWVCLDRRLWNLVEKRQAASDAEIAGSDERETGDGDVLEERLGRIADTAATPDVLAEYKEALTLLNENERTALFLCYVEGLPEESEDPAKPSAAKVLGVTGRSVRNYLRRAKDKLMRWEQSAQAV